MVCYGVPVFAGTAKYFCPSQLLQKSQAGVRTDGGRAWAEASATGTLEHQAIMDAKEAATSIVAEII
jgi:hypothetical protein